MADTQYLDGLLDQFLAKFPLESLQTMSLEQYTDVVEKGKTNDSFTYWVESKTRELGSIKGGSSEKFNIYKYNKTPTSKYFLHDNTYTWYARLGQTKDEAWEKTRGIIYEVAKLASEKKFSEIDKIDELWPGYKWKIAFLYSGKSIPNTFKLEAIKYVAKTYGKDFGKSQNFAEIYEFLLSQKSENENFWDFGKSIWKKWNDSGEDMEEEKKLTVEDYTNLLINTHNLILHGAPGTGKTHLAKDIAAQIMLNKNYNQLSDEEKESIKDQIGFVQFHPSFDYTDFIEGLRPVYNENDDVIFERKDGVFKKFCKNALPIIIKNNKSISNFDYIWNVLINKIRENIANNSLTKIGNWEYGLSSKNSLKYQSLDSKSKYNFTITKQNIYDVWQGKKARPKGGFQKDMVDIVSYMKELGLKDYSKDESSSFSLDIINEDAVKNALDNIVKEQIKLTLKTGATYIFQIQKKDDEYQIFVKTSTVSKLHKDTFDFTCSNIINYITKKEEESKELDQNLNSYIGVVSDYIKNHYKIFKTEFVFIIDEINRGELSKIFGELFYCIDPGYRGECGKISTQYQNLIEEDDPFYEGFYIPDNVYIIGTMNDIDRSVESMDFAFRRRFTFKEITAEDTQESILAELDETIRAEAIKRMNSLNNKIWHKPTENEAYEDQSIEGLSSAYHIGGAYFLKLKELNYDFDKLWEYHLSGLLREYLRGMEDAEELLEKLHKAYNLESQE